MPFFGKYNKNKQKYSAHLQVQRSHIYLLKKRKRVCSFTSPGSISIEAAMALTVFIGMVLFMVSFLIMVSTQFSVQMKLNNIALITAKGKFYVQLADKVTDYNDTLKKIKTEIEENKNKITENDMWNKVKGSIYENNGIDDVTDIRLNYVLKTSFLDRTIAIKQRSMVRDWTGSDITKSQNIVYITQNGKVYHLTKECSHLALSISSTSYASVKGLRNNYGEKYSKCGICVTKKPESGTKVFIAEDGNRYHLSLTCSGIVRNIIATDKESVTNMPACSSCGKE